MHHHHDGLSIWYDTPDAPAGAGTMMIGVSPYHPANQVVVEIRRSGSAPFTRAASPLPGGQALLDARARESRQYFRVAFPFLRAGEEVDVRPVVSCAGRVAPPPHTDPSGRQTGWFAYRHDVSRGGPAPAPTAPEKMDRPSFRAGLAWLGTVSAHLLSPPETIGVCPQGLQRNFYIARGTCTGPGLTATIRPEGGDWMLIQRDGVALPNVRTTWETPEGALLYGEYSGVFDLGRDGYEGALRGHFPAHPLVQLAPRFVTSHPRYAWLNRIQCVGIGQVDMAALHVEYDLYAVRGGERLDGARPEGPAAASFASPLGRAAPPTLAEGGRRRGCP